MSGPIPTRVHVFVRGLEVEAGIGVHDHERDRRQRLVIDVDLDLEPRPVARLADTVDYQTIARAARDLAAEGHIGLVETFAERLARACLEDDRVVAARVRIEKPGALGDAAVPGCEVRYVRDAATVASERHGRHLPGR